MEEILHQLIGGKHPFIGFQPSKVVQDFFHPQYVQWQCSIAGSNSLVYTFGFALNETSQVRDFNSCTAKS